MKQTTSWGKSAPWYKEHIEGGDTYHAKVVLPNLVRLLEIKKDEKVLDVPCGEGFFARAIVRAGAKAMGVDIAPEFIVMAREKKGGVHYEISNAEKMPFIKDGEFDAVVSVFGLQNIDNVAGAVTEFSRALKKGGRLLIVLNHPAFRIPKGSSWGWDEVLKTQYRRIDHYLFESKEKIQMHPGDAPEEVTLSFHRPLQYYCKALFKAGFVVRRLEEWNSHRRSGPGPRRVAEDIARKEIPLFLCIEAVKQI